MTLEVYDLGAYQKSAQFVIDDGLDVDLIAMEIYLAVGKMKGLRSRSYECIWNADTNTGGVYAGMRIVGKVRRLK